MVMRFKHKWLIIILAVVSIIMINIITYHCILEMFFTGCDSIVIIKTSRIFCWSDFARVLTTNTKIDFYRPVANLVFSMNYSIWNLNPFGYHLTDLILHILVAITVFAFVALLSPGRTVTAWVCGLLFSIHPISKFVVPATERIYEPLSTLFILLTLILFILYTKATVRKNILYFSSIFMFLLTILSKEVAVVVPFLIFSYVLLFPEEKLSVHRIWRALKLSSPFFLIITLFLFRYFQLIGAMRNEIVIWCNSALLNRLNIIWLFLVKILLPTDSLNDTLGVTFFDLLFVFIFFLMIPKMVMYLKTKGRIFRKTIICFLIIGFIISNLSVGFSAIILRPINEFVKGEYNSDSPKIFSMQDKDKITLQFYLSTFKRFYIGLHLMIIAICTLSLLIITNGKNIIDRIKSSMEMKRIIFLSIFLILPLMLYCLALSVTGRYLYLPAIPLIIILSFLSMNSWKHILNRAKIKDNTNPGKSSRKIIQYFTALITTGLIVLFIANSAIFMGLDDWKVSSDTTRDMLSRFEEIVAQSPGLNKITISNFPNYFRDYPEFTMLWSEPVQNWLEMRFPQRNFYVICTSYFHPDAYPTEIRLICERISLTEIKIEVQFIYS